MTRGTAHTRTATPENVPATEELQAIESTIRRRAAEYPALRRVLVVDEGDSLDLQFFVAEPFNASEDQVLPLVRDVLEMARLLELDFMIAPAGPAEDAALSEGARPVYEYGASAPR